MLDGVTLDQLRMLVAVVEEGSFSAAARRLRRVQSAVSHAMARLEEQLGVPIWDRSTRAARLTAQGEAILAAARGVCAQADALHRLAASLTSGLEPSVAVCVDAMFPLRALVELCRGFAREHPTVQLKVHTEAMMAVAERVLDGSCQIGIGGPITQVEGLSHRHLATVHLFAAAAASHPLAALRGRIATERLREEIQIVLSERHLPGAPDQAVLSAQTWRVQDLSTKHALIKAGLGWGNLPEHAIRGDLKKGRLSRLWPAAWGVEGYVYPLSLLHRPELSMGPATRWLVQRIEELCHRDLPARG
ncbi:MAG TPA: LysR family transcriptional regulator [Candidatus Nanopelagicales bacterium]|nr:LysR family transcriptional regulator [Candidatus Nanopelagicales bacterium]